MFDWIQRDLRRLPPLIGVFMMLGLSGCYSLKQIYYQGNLLSTRERTEILLWRKDTPEKLRQDLALVEDILAFAEDQGLSVGGAYRSYIKTPRPVVSYLVSAAKEFELEPKTWWFPIVGEVPYLGFYHKEDRDRELNKLKKEGYDVDSGVAGAFSSLGWYDDPIYSSMLDRDIGDLAHLLFHELIHRTLWISGSVQFNENLAEYGAEVLTEQYLTSKKLLTELRKYRNTRADHATYNDWLKKLRESLEKTYSGPLQENKNALRKEKALVFSRYTTALFPNFESKSYRKIKTQKWNNAVVLSSSIYSPDKERFQRAWLCSKASKIGDFLKSLKRTASSGVSDLDLLDQLCI